VVLHEPAAAGRVSVRSAAVPRALSHTGAGWRLLARVVDWPVARRLLDVAYSFVARNRHRWFGEHDTCALPDPALRDRLLD
jgi:predicted DCC family thiol-disulfide oxidoreductase YuxK